MSAWISHPTTLIGKTVDLIPLEKSHLPELEKLAKDQRIWEFYAYDASNSERFTSVFTAALAAREAGTEYPFVIFHKAENKIIGSTRFLDLVPQHKKLEIGSTWLHPDYWASEVNLECKLLLLTHCFEDLNIVRVQLKTDENNIRSRKAIEKIGGQFEGILRNDMIRDNQTKRNSAYFSLLEEEWTKKKNLLVHRLSMKKQLLLFCFLFSLNNAAYSNSKIQKFKNSSNSNIQAIQIFKYSNPQKKHPFHVSKFDIVYNSKENTWQITGHIFIDDLESALRKQGIDKLFLCSNKETAQAQDYVVRYLKQHFSIEINEKITEWTFLGKETSDDLKAIWCYMEIKNASVPQSMVIKNNVLTEVFGDQKNMISVTDATQQKSYSIFTAQKTKEKVF